MYNKTGAMLCVGQPRNNGSIPGRCKRLSSPLHGIQTGSVAHPDSYSMGITGSFLKGKSAAA